MAKATQKKVQDQAELNTAAIKALTDLATLKKCCVQELEPRMWGYDLKALSMALQVVKQLLVNQTTTSGQVPKQPPGVGARPARPSK